MMMLGGSGRKQMCVRLGSFTFIQLFFALYIELKIYSIRFDCMFFLLYGQYVDPLYVLIMYLCSKKNYYFFSLKL